MSDKKETAKSDLGISKRSTRLARIIDRLPDDGDYIIRLKKSSSRAWKVNIARENRIRVMDLQR